MDLTNLRPLALTLVLALTPAVAGAQNQPPGALDVPQDPLLQRPQAIPQSPVIRSVPAQPQYSTMPTPTYQAVPPPLVPPSMVPQGLLPPNVPPGSTQPIPMPSPMR